MNGISLRGRVLRALAPRSTKIYRLIDTDVELRLCGQSVVVPVSGGTAGRLDPGMSVDVQDMDYLCVPRELTALLEQRLPVVTRVEGA